MVSIDRLVLAGAPSAARTSVSHSKPQQPMDSQQGELGWPFDSGPVGMHTSPPLIGRYRSIPSCNRPAFLRLVRLLTVLIIAASAMCQTKSLVTNGPIERSVGMNAALSVAAPCAFVPILRQGRSSDTRTRSATVATRRRKYAAELTTERCL
jgi:hypothetical protein